MTDVSIRSDNEWSTTYGDIGTQPRKELRELPIRALTPWTDADGNHQPFGYTDDQMDTLLESVKERGVIEPISVRPLPDGRFQIIAGHHRVLAATKAGMNTIPALIEDIDDNTAAVRMVDSNLVRRDNIDPVTLGKAYRIKLEALRREGKADNIGGDMSDHSRASIYRYIRLTYLVGSMETLAAKRKIALVPASEMSYLDADAQQLVADAIATKSIKPPNKDMAKAIRTLYEDGSLNYDSLIALYEPDDDEEPEMIYGRFREFFPDAVSDDELSDCIYKALQQMRAGRSD